MKWQQRNGSWFFGKWEVRKTSNGKWQGRLDQRPVGFISRPYKTLAEAQADVERRAA